MPLSVAAKNLQDRINGLAQSGGRIDVPAGTYDLGTTTLYVPQGQHNTEIYCEPGTIFVYHGTGPALLIGGNDTNTERCTLWHCEIHLATDAPDAVCLKLVRAYWCNILGVKLTSQSYSTPRQTALMISGGATVESSFSAYNLISNPAIVGGFKRGIHFCSELPNGPSTRDRSNANLVLGGSVWCGANDRTGSVGIHIQHGDTNRIIGTDHDSLEVGTLIEGHNNQVNARYENIFRKAVQVCSTSMGSYINGCSIPANEWQDDGYETQYVLTSQAGVNTTCLTDLRARYSFQLIPRSGNPPNLDNGTMWYDNGIKAVVNNQVITLGPGDGTAPPSEPTYTLKQLVAAVFLALAFCLLTFISILYSTK